MNKTQLQFASRKPSANRGSLGRRLSALAMSLLLVCSLPLAAFADTWYLEDGDITVNATESGQTVTQGSGDAVEDNAPVITQTAGTETKSTVTITAMENATANVTIQDVNIVISEGTPTDHTDKAAVTIDVAQNAKANVTLHDVKIDVGGTGGYDEDQEIYATGEAAVQIVGNGDVTMELDGENTIKSGFWRAGVEKNSGGELTITDENETHGSLETTGGYSGSGIGGGLGGSGSKINITGNAEVTAQGGDFGSGIGGGWNGSGINITISGSAEVTANGGDSGSGIGGGGGGSGGNIKISDTAEVTAKGGIGGAGIGGGDDSGSGIDITITGSAEVTAQGGNVGSGIGGGHNGSGSNITISGDAQVKAQGGEVIQVDDWYYSEGAAIGDGGAGRKNAYPDPGAEVDPDIRKLTPSGRIEYYAPGADMEKDASIKTVTGTYVPPQPENPVQSAQPEDEAPQPAALYRVVGQDGMAVGGKTEQKDGVLTITVDADYASLTGYLGGLQGLRAQGVETIVFVTKGVTSTFALADLLASMTAGDSYALTHDGETVTFTLATGTDISGILK